MLGAFIVVSFFSIILYREIKIATNTKDLFYKYLAFSMMFQMIFQAIMNLIVVIGMIPVTGVALWLYTKLHSNFPLKIKCFRRFVM